METKEECRSWHWLFAWLCFIWAALTLFVCTLWGQIAVLGCSLWYWTFGGGQCVTLFLPFFYPQDGGNKDVPSRAGTLIHEARHIGNKPHNATFPPESDYGAGEEGADSHWGYEGAWMFEALYLWWFYAAGTRTSIAMRDAAKHEANYTLKNAFANPPSYVVL